MAKQKIKNENAPTSMNVQDAEKVKRLRNIISDTNGITQALAKGPLKKLVEAGQSAKKACAVALATAGVGALGPVGASLDWFGSNDTALMIGGTALVVGGAVVAAKGVAEYYESLGRLRGSQEVQQTTKAVNEELSAVTSKVRVTDESIADKIIANVKFDQEQKNIYKKETSLMSKAEDFRQSQKQSREAFEKSYSQREERFQIKDTKARERVVDRQNKLDIERDNFDREL